MLTNYDSQVCKPLRINRRPSLPTLTTYGNGPSNDQNGWNDWVKIAGKQLIYEEISPTH